MAVDAEGREWADAEVDDGWLRPAVAAGGVRREPRWGHPDGIQVGLHPLSGPRGLLRIYTPYLGHARERLLNFLAVEPIPAGSTERGYSELERSRLDDVPGLRMWSVDHPDDEQPHDPVEPARGTVETGPDGVERLVVHVGVERFANGAHVGVTVTFRADRPHEFDVAAVARADSTPLAVCVLSATMGNWARLRRLELADGAAIASELWPDYRDVHFAPHASFPLDRLRADGEAVSVSAFPDEASPSEAVHAEGTAAHWQYSGERGVQTWIAADPDPALVAQVNGRHTYWMSEHAIPGGIAFENFELVEPFRQGRALTFRVEPMDAA
ncbi:hypothetical protein ACFC1W_06410 [Microbacterium sp. NPDC056003]|uniref:hypothetical protein n=1 Tax=Microbacterium sp. NPDC056003 TaxID=3345676 RepID=UPI0035DA54B2